MIKRILVALDPDPDTPVATRYSIRLAKRFDAGVTGLAVIDTRNFQSTIGAGYSGHNIWMELSEDTREVASKLLTDFRTTLEKEMVRHSAIKQEGVSFERIIEEMKYHDLLVVGRDSHFFYSEPETKTDTLAQVVKGGVSPTLVVTEEYRDVEKVLIAFDGSAPAARSLQGFVHLLPYGKDIEVELMNVTTGNKGQDMDHSVFVLNQAEKYLKEHNFNYVTKKVLEKGTPSERIIEREKELDPDLIVLGAHSVSAVRRAAFGSTTFDMIKQTEKPLFLSP